MTVSGLHVTQSPVVRISAVRASYGYCMHLKTINEFKSAGPYVSEIIDGLVAIATQFSCEVLALCLETLCVVLEVDDELTAKNESKITPLAIAILLKYPHGNTSWSASASAATAALLSRSPHRGFIARCVQSDGRQPAVLCVCRAAPPSNPSQYSAGASRQDAYWNGSSE